MKYRDQICVTLIVCLALVYGCTDTQTTSCIQISVAKPAGCIESLIIDGRETKLSAEEGGFFVYDATNKKDIRILDGSMKHSVGKTVFSCKKSGDIKLHAEFSNRGEYILVTGYIENLRTDDRGIILDYRIPVSGEDVVFCNELNQSVKIDDSEQEGNVYPIAAICKPGLSQKENIFS